MMRSIKFPLTLRSPAPRRERKTFAINGEVTTFDDRGRSTGHVRMGTVELMRHANVLMDAGWAEVPS